MPFIIFLLALFVAMTFLKDYNSLRHFTKQEQIHFLESYKTKICQLMAGLLRHLLEQQQKDQRTLLPIVVKLKNNPTEPSPLQQFRIVNFLPDISSGPVEKRCLVSTCLWNSWSVFDWFWAV